MPEQFHHKQVQPPYQIHKNPKVPKAFHRHERYPVDFDKGVSSPGRLHYGVLKLEENVLPAGHRFSLKSFLSRVYFDIHLILLGLFLHLHCLLEVPNPLFPGIFQAS